MEVISGLTIKDECVAIDDKHFIDCTLINCILEYSGSDVAFDATRIRGCRYVFFGRARQTLQFLQRGPDGTRPA
jgi:hypothetical protein